MGHAGRKMLCDWVLWLRLLSETAHWDLPMPAVPQVAFWRKHVCPVEHACQKKKTMCSRMTLAFAGRKRLRGSTCLQLGHHFASFRTCVQCTVCWEMVCFCCCLCPRRWALETRGSCHSTDTGTAIA